MAYQPLEELLPKTNNSVYRLSRIAGKRAMEIALTGQHLISGTSLNQKLTTSALEEIRFAKVVDKLNGKAFAPKKN